MQNREYDIIAVWSDGFLEEMKGRLPGEVS